VSQVAKSGDRSRHFGKVPAKNGCGELPHGINARRGKPRVLTIGRLIAGCSESPATLRRQDAGKSFEEQERMSAALHSVYWEFRSTRNEQIDLGKIRRCWGEQRQASRRGDARGWFCVGGAFVARFPLPEWVPYFWARVAYADGPLRPPESCTSSWTLSLSPL